LGGCGSALRLRLAELEVRFATALLMQLGVGAAVLGGAKAGVRLSAHSSLGGSVEALVDRVGLKRLEFR
jgi:hypothetical protein